jgi:hypothetical protein
MLYAGALGAHVMFFVTNYIERVRVTQRQLLQRREPPFGFTSRLRRETLLQRWIHRNALAPLQEFYFYFINDLLLLQC